MGSDPSNGSVSCSLCKQPLLGRSVGLFDHFDTGVEWEDAGFEVYEAFKFPETTRKFVLLHESCFNDLVGQLSKQELSTVIVLALGTIEDIRIAMEM